MDGQQTHCPEEREIYVVRVQVKSEEAMKIDEKKILSSCFDNDEWISWNNTKTKWPTYEAVPELGFRIKVRKR